MRPRGLGTCRPPGSPPVHFNAVQGAIGRPARRSKTRERRPTYAAASARCVPGEALGLQQHAWGSLAHSLTLPCMPRERSHTPGALPPRRWLDAPRRWPTYAPTSCGSASAVSTTARKAALDPPADTLPQSLRSVGKAQADEPVQPAASCTAPSPPSHALSPQRSMPRRMPCQTARAAGAASASRYVHLLGGKSAWLVPCRTFGPPFEEFC